MEDRFEQLMRHGLEEFSIELSDEQMERFFKYYRLLIEWNKVMNLTSIVEMEDMVKKHFVDSLSLVKILPKESIMDSRILDLGTGAGFPGIPIKIVFPESRIVLMDSLNKRINFLNEVTRELDLKNIETVHGRAEDWGRDPLYREQFDLCVSRAVANLSTLLEYCSPFVRIGGYFISYKSGKAEEEIGQAKGALKLLGCRIESVEEFDLPGSDMARTLIKIKKTEGTSKKYPRKAGLPGKDPLR